MISTTSAQVLRQAQAALEASPFHPLRELVVECQEKTLRIRGEVQSFYHKQLAQEAVMSVSHGFEVVNAVEVDYR